MFNLQTAELSETDLDQVSGGCPACVILAWAPYLAELLALGLTMAAVRKEIEVSRTVGEAKSRLDDMAAAQRH
jgi:hypothetical protein